MAEFPPKPFKTCKAGERRSARIAKTRESLTPFFRAMPEKCLVCELEGAHLGVCDALVINDAQSPQAIDLDVEAGPEFPGLKATRLHEEIDRLRRLRVVDYQGVADAKMGALKLTYQAFLRHGTKERREAFARFRDAGGSTLTRFACFEWLRRKFGHPWWEWPHAWRRVEDENLARIRYTEAETIGLFEFVQWLAHDQLDCCRAKAHERKLPLGLYLDIAVGVRTDGFDAWCDQDAVLAGMAVGAPPDQLNSAGQNWGLAGFNPLGLEHRQFEPFRRLLRAAMQYAGAVRLDHVLGLQRLYLIP